MPSPPSDSSRCRTPGSASPDQVATPVSVVAGCSTHQWAASRSLSRSAARASTSSPPAGPGAGRGRGPRPPPAVPSRPLRAWDKSTSDHRQSGPENRVVERVWGNPKVKISEGVWASRRAGRPRPVRRAGRDEPASREPGADRNPRRTRPRSCQRPRPPTSRRPGSDPNPRRTRPRSRQGRDHPRCRGPPAGVSRLGAGAPRTSTTGARPRAGRRGPEPRRTRPRGCQDRDHRSARATRTTTTRDAREASASARSGNWQ